MTKKTKHSKPRKPDAEKVYWWCVEEYGRSKINGSYPELEFKHPDYLTEGLCGEYDYIENTIFVNRKENKTLIELIDTMIHEWTHYHQPIRSHLQKMAKEGKLHRAFEEKDPLEIEARKVARRDRSKCFKELFS